MDITIQPGKLRGKVSAVASKSHTHRLLIAAAFSDRETTLICPETNLDIQATVSCLISLGANIIRNQEGYIVSPISTLPGSAVLDCGESGSTLRFLLPVVGALGVDTTFVMHGRLSQRPLTPLLDEMIRMGCKITRPGQSKIHCCGKLTSGIYSIDGTISSQFISGLLFAAALMDGYSKIQITGNINSLPYIHMTQSVLMQFGVDTNNFEVHSRQQLRSPGIVTAEGDWSNGAFFLAANALGSTIEITNLDGHSLQGDRAAVEIIPKLQNNCIISASNTPDLVPVLAVVACANNGAIFTDTKRLRTKESDRVEAIAQMLRCLGGCVETEEDSITVYPAKLHGGTVDSCGDHRIAMAAAIAATVSDGPVTILGGQCVSKSYPSFWEEYKKLGGNYEQYIR